MYTASTAALGHHRLCCCVCCGGGAAAVVVLMVVVLLLSRLCEDDALSRTQQARYAVVGVFAILSCGCWVTCTADRYHTM